MTNPTPRGQVPEALRLAEMLTADEWPGSVTLVSYARECVAELRRLHAENERLAAAPKAAPPAPLQQSEYPATGNPEADRVLGRLNSSDPGFDDCAEAAALIYKLVAEIKGPEGFSTWKDAAVYERGLRATLETTINTASPLAYLYTDGKHPGLDFEHAPAEDIRPGFVCIPLVAAHLAARGAAQAAPASPYHDGVNIESLQRACRAFGLRTDDSLEAFVSPDVHAEHVNRLTRAVIKYVLTRPAQPAAPQGDGVPTWQAAQDPMLECSVQPRPLSHPLAAYHSAMSKGPLHYTWQDKPHRLVYDLIAAVKHYANQAGQAAPAAQGDALDAARLEFAMSHGLPMERDGLFRYHGFAEQGWHTSKLAAIDAAMADKGAPT